MILSWFWIENFDNVKIKNNLNYNYYTAFAIFCVALLLLLLVVVRYSLKKVSLLLTTGQLKMMNKRNKKNYQRIPAVYSSFSVAGFRLPLPLLIETIIVAAQIKLEGLRILKRFFHQRHKEDPIVTVPLLNVYATAIKCPTLIQKLLASTNPSILSKPRDFFKFALPNDLLNGLPASELEVWQPHRKILSRAFNFQSCNSHAEIINRRGKLLVSALFDHVAGTSSRSRRSLTDIIGLHVLGTASGIVMGEGVVTDEETEAFRYHVVQQKSLLSYKLLNPKTLALLPVISSWLINPKMKALETHYSKMWEHCKTAVTRCKERIQQRDNSQQDELGSKKEKSRSLVEEMLSKNLTEMEIASEVGAFLLAGSGTTSATINYFLQNVAEHKYAQKLCQEEVDAVFDSKTSESSNAEGNGNNLTMSDLANLKYLERCILETLRITPAAPSIFRKLSAPLEIDGFSFKKDTILWFPIWAIHRDPKIYPNPEKFDPERFLPENVVKRSSGSFFPFSLGPRNCIGQKVAMMELKIILAWILRHFNVSSSDKLEDVKIVYEFIASPVRDYNIALTKRKQNVFS